MSARRLVGEDVADFPNGVTLLQAIEGRRILFSAHVSSANPEARVRFWSIKPEAVLFELGSHETRDFGRRGIDLAEHGGALVAQAVEGLGVRPIVVDVVFGVEREIS